jgi:hypothetical protein
MATLTPNTKKKVLGGRRDSRGGGAAKATKDSAMGEAMQEAFVIWRRMPLKTKQVASKILKELDKGNSGRLDLQTGDG